MLDGAATPPLLNVVASSFWPTNARCFKGRSPSSSHSLGRLEGADVASSNDSVVSSSTVVGRGSFDGACNVEKTLYKHICC